MLWKDIEGISKEGKQVMKGKMIILRETSANAFFFSFWYYEAKKFTCDLEDLAQHSFFQPCWCVSPFHLIQLSEETYRHWPPPPTPTPATDADMSSPLGHLQAHRAELQDRCPWQGWKELGAPSYSLGFSGHNGLHRSTRSFRSTYRLLVSSRDPQNFN